MGDTSFQIAAKQKFDCTLWLANDPGLTDFW